MDASQQFWEGETWSFLKLEKSPKLRLNYHLKKPCVFSTCFSRASCCYWHTTAPPKHGDRPKPGRPLTPPGHLGVHGSKFGGDMAGSGCCHCNDHHFDRLFATLYGLRSVIFFFPTKKREGVRTIVKGEDLSWRWWELADDDDDDDDFFSDALRFQLVICIYVGGVFGMMFLRQYLPGKERFFLQVMGRLVVSVDLLMTMRSAFVHHTCKKNH